MKDIIFVVAESILVLILAPLSLGLVRFFKARLQTRRGPSPFLPYWSILTLLKKEMTISRNSSWVFRIVPFVALAAAIMLSLLLPVLVSQKFGLFNNNIFLVSGILMIGSIFLVLGGMDVASTFGGMGSSREMTLATLVEPAAFVVFATMGLATKTWNWTEILSAFAKTPWYVLNPFLFLTLVALILIILAENARYPVDNPATHLELTMVHEAMILEYSGPFLAMIEYAGMIRLTVLSLLFMNIVMPPYFYADANAQSFLAAVGMMVLKLVIAMGFLALLESVIAKMRFYRMQEYMVTAFLLSLAGFVLLIFF